MVSMVSPNVTGCTEDQTMSRKTIEFVERLVASFDALKPLYDEHKADNLGEVLPHVLMGDVTRFAIRKCEETRAENASRRSDAELLVKNLLAFLEDAYSREGGEVGELISVSFLELLPRPDEGSASGIRQWVGPRMRAQLAVIA